MHFGTAFLHETAPAPEDRSRSTCSIFLIVCSCVCKSHSDSEECWLSCFNQTTWARGP